MWTVKLTELSDTHTSVSWDLLTAEERVGFASRSDTIRLRSVTEVRCRPRCRPAVWGARRSARVDCSQAYSCAFLPVACAYARPTRRSSSGSLTSARMPRSASCPTAASSTTSLSRSSWPRSRCVSSGTVRNGTQPYASVLCLRWLCHVMTVHAAHAGRGRHPCHRCWCWCRCRCRRWLWLWLWCWCWCWVGRGLGVER